MKFIAKKIAVIIGLAGYAHCTTHELALYYKLSMHVTHDDNDYAREEWNQSASLVSALAQRCQETADDTSAQAFNDCQRDAIQTLKTVCGLCTHKYGLHVDIDSSSNQLPMPKKGLFILFEYFVASSTPHENKVKIDTLMQQLRENNTTQKHDVLLSHLCNLETIFSLMSGEAGLAVHNFEGQ